MGPINLSTSIRCVICLHTDYLTLAIEAKRSSGRRRRGDLHIISEQPTGLGRKQGWGLWAEINGASAES